MIAYSRNGDAAMQSAELALKDAERAVVAGVAFRLAEIDRWGIDVELFDFPEYRVVFIALVVFHKQYPNDRQAPPSRLIPFIAATPELWGLFSDETITLEEIGNVIGPGNYEVDSLPGNVEALREAQFQRKRRQKLAELERLPRDRFLRETHNWLASLSESRPRAEIALTNVSTVEPKSVSWLWPNRIPAGKLSLLCGDPGLGKSHATMDIAARVSNGWQWPDDPTTSPPGKVIIFSAEDDIADTIRPRLDRAGADVRNVYCLESVTTPDPKTGELKHAAFSLAEHVPLLADSVNKLGNVKLIIIDPVSSYTGTTDSHKNAEVRTMLAPLVDLAEAQGFAILAVTHLSKGAGGKAVYRATGSLAFAAAARAVWMLAKDLDDPSRRLLLPVKCNIAPELSGLAFCIQSDSGGSFVAWEADPVAMTGDGYLAEEQKRQTSGKEDDESARSEAVEFLKDRLAAGPVVSKDLEADAKEHGIKQRTLERAVKELQVKSRKRGDGKWEKYIPESTPPDNVRQPPPPGGVGGHGGHGEVAPRSGPQPENMFANSANFAGYGGMTDMPGGLAPEDAASNLTPSGKRKPRRRPKA